MLGGQLQPAPPYVLANRFRVLHDVFGKRLAAERPLVAEVLAADVVHGSTAEAVFVVLVIKTTEEVSVPHHALAQIDGDDVAVQLVVVSGSVTDAREAEQAALAFVA